MRYRAGSAAKVVLVIGEKYLRSTFCMAELFEVFLRCGGQADEFRERVVPITLACATISTPFDRGRHGDHWRSEHEKLSAYHRGGGVLATDDYAEWQAMMTWAAQVPNVLSFVAKTLHPVGFDRARADDYRMVRQFLDR